VRGRSFIRDQWPWRTLRERLILEILAKTPSGQASTHLPAFGVLMIDGMSRAEILESLPEGFCDDCWQQSLDRRQQFSTDPEEDYHWVYYVTHIWDGI
jgi:hypothetical protein